MVKATGNVYYLLRFDEETLEGGPLFRMGSCYATYLLKPVRDHADFAKSVEIIKRTSVIVGSDWWGPVAETYDRPLTPLELREIACKEDFPYRDRFSPY